MCNVRTEEGGTEPRTVREVTRRATVLLATCPMVHRSSRFAAYHHHSQQNGDHYNPFPRHSSATSLHNLIPPGDSHYRTAYGGQITWLLLATAC